MVLLEDLPHVMPSLDLAEEPLPLWWTTDFINASPPGTAAEEECLGKTEGEVFCLFFFGLFGGSSVCFFLSFLEFLLKDNMFFLVCRILCEFVCVCQPFPRGKATILVFNSRGTIHVLWAMVQRSGHNTCEYHGISRLLLAVTYLRMSLGQKSPTDIPIYRRFLRFFQVVHECFKPYLLQTQHPFCSPSWLTSQLGALTQPCAAHQVCACVF